MLMHGSPPDHVMHHVLTPLSAVLKSVAFKKREFSVSGNDVMFYLARFAPAMRVVALAGGNVTYENLGLCMCWALRRI